MKMTFLPEFFEREVRCGYTVEPEMKKIWAVELDLLNELLRVCRKYHLEVMASGGTLLGAIRHGGMIPWDDDIDMMMLRADYEKLCQVAEQEFTHPYFFQTEYTDRGSMRGHAQLRNETTTAILKEEGKVPFHQGIFIDIFPLDAVVEDEQKFAAQGRKVKRYKKIAHDLYTYTDRYKDLSHNWKRNLIHAGAMILNAVYSYDRWYARFEKACAMYNDLETEKISTLCFLFDKKRHQKYRKDYLPEIEMPFEMLRIPVANDYEHALTQEFGDWREPVMDGSNHGKILFDTEKSYREYLKEE